MTEHKPITLPQPTPDQMEYLAMIVLLDGDLYRHKIHAAEFFANLSHVGLVERRTADALNDIKDSLKAQGEKLDRLIERRV